MVVSEFRSGGVDKTGEHIDEDAGLGEVAGGLTALIKSELHGRSGHEVHGMEPEDFARLQGREVPGSRRGLMNWGLLVHAARLPLDLGSGEIGTRRTSGGHSHRATDSCEVQVYTVQPWRG